MAQRQKRIVKVEEKQALVDSLHERFEKAASAVVFAYQGLTVEETTALRDKIRAAGGSMSVVKNTMLRRAVAGTGLEPLQEHFFGPSAMCFSSPDDPVTPVKELVEFAKGHEPIRIKAGALEGKPISDKEVKALAKLPSKEQLIAKMLGSMNAPATNLVGALSGVARNLVYALEQIRKQKEAA